MFNGLNLAWVSDRNGRANSALYVNGGYAQIDANTVSWTGDLSIMAWVYVISQVGFSKLIDCGTQNNLEIVFTLNWPGIGHSWQVFNGGASFIGNNNVLCCAWQHIAVTQSAGNVALYTNAVLVASGTSQNPYITAGYGTCWLGKSLWNDGNINSYVDDLWFFNRGLSQSEVSTVMNYYV